MAYPFIINNNYLRKYLIDKKIFIPTYWDGQADNNVGEYFKSYLYALPIDQRYDIDDMKSNLT